MSEFSSGSNSEYFRQKRTLQREGIAPATLSSIPGSSFGKAAAAKHRQGAQQSHSEQFSELRKSSGQRHEPLVHDSGRSCSSFLPRVDWLPLGEGWYQTTPIGTGSTNKAGLHSVIESSLGQFFMCLYEPRLQQVAQAVTSQNPEYNLEVSVKSLPLVSNSISAVNNSKNYGNIEIVFGFMSVTSYFSLKCMITTRSWRISRVDSNEELVLREVSDEKIRPNLFSSVLLQIRGATISVDINGVPVFTNIRGTLGENINGLVGFMAKVLPIINF